MNPKIFLKKLSTFSVIFKEKLTTFPQKFYDCLKNIGLIFTGKCESRDISKIQANFSELFFLSKYNFS